MMGVGGGRKDDDAGVADDREVWYPGDLVMDSPLLPQILEPKPDINRTSACYAENVGETSIHDGDGGYCRVAMYQCLEDECAQIWPRTPDGTRRHVAWKVAFGTADSKGEEAGRKYCARHCIDLPPQGRPTSEAIQLTDAYLLCLQLRQILRPSRTPASVHGAAAWWVATKVCALPSHYRVSTPSQEVVALGMDIIECQHLAPDPSRTLPPVATRRSGLAIYDETWIREQGRQLGPAGEHVLVQGAPGSDAADLTALASQYGPETVRQLAILWQARETEAARKAAKAQARRSRRAPDPWRVLREAERKMPLEQRLALYQLRHRVMFSTPSGGSEG